MNGGPGGLVGSLYPHSFNVIHLETMFKVDVFILKTDFPYGMEGFARKTILGKPEVEIGSRKQLLADGDCFRGGDYR